MIAAEPDVFSNLKLLHARLTTEDLALAGSDAPRVPFMAHLK